MASEQDSATKASGAAPLSSDETRAAEENSAKQTALHSRIGLVLGPCVFLLILLFVDLDPSNPLVTRMAAVIAWMAIWWITEAIPLAATALLPIVLFPLLGLMRGRAQAAAGLID